MHRCQYNKTWSSQDNIPAGNLNWSQREDNDDDCINTNKQICSEITKFVLFGALRS